MIRLLLPENESGFIDISTPVLPFRVDYFPTGPYCVSFTPTLVLWQYFHFIQLEILRTRAEPEWRSRYSVYATAWTVRCSNPDRSKRFFSSHPNSFSVGTTGVFFRGLNQPGRECNHSSLSSGDVKNEWSSTSTPSTRRYDVDKEKFKFPIIDSHRRNLPGGGGNLG